MNNSELKKREPRNEREKLMLNSEFIIQNFSSRHAEPELAEVKNLFVGKKKRESRAEKREKKLMLNSEFIMLNCLSRHSEPELAEVKNLFVGKKKRETRGEKRERKINAEF